ncbi:MAG: FtsX-like permease family protein [Promethearchaeota archaeon]
MSSFDFALKDLYRKKKANYPFLIIIILTVTITEFLIYFTSSLGLNIFIQSSFLNTYYFTSGINLVYKQFNSLVQILLIVLTISIVIGVCTTLIVSKKKDIAIMKSLGTLPRELYSFFLLEVYILFIIGFILGLILGLVTFGIFALIMFFVNFPILFHFDIFFTLFTFISCIIGIFFVSGYAIRRIGRQKIIRSFSKDIPYNYNAGKPLKLIPKWLTSIGFNIKIAVVNTLRKKGEFQRYLILFSIIGILIFTLSIGTVVINFSSREWINKSQNENIVIIGHEDVVYNYSLMYRMFSDPQLLISEANINFTDSQYFFNLSDIQSLENIAEIEKIDERIISFYDVEELTGTIITEDGSYVTVGQDRTGNIPIIGVNPDNIIQNFEIEGRFFTEEDAFFNMTIADGLAQNFFDFPLFQRLELTGLSKVFHIAGVVIDSFYSGWSGYISINESRKLLDLNNDEVNLIMLKLSPGTYEGLSETLENVTNTIGEKFTFLRLDQVFQTNLNFVSSLSVYPIILIMVISTIAILSLYNYQKSGILEKAQDFLIMRAIGSKTKSLKKILFMESILVIIPSLLLSLGIGMIINSLFLFKQIYLPPLYIPFLFFLILFIIFMIFNFLSLFPIIKKINKFSIKDFSLY